MKSLVSFQPHGSFAITSFQVKAFRLSVSQCSVPEKRFPPSIVSSHQFIGCWAGSSLGLLTFFLPFARLCLWLAHTGEEQETGRCQRALHPSFPRPAPSSAASPPAPRIAHFPQCSWYHAGIWAAASSVSPCPHTPRLPAFPRTEPKRETSSLCLGD